MEEVCKVCGKAGHRTGECTEAPEETGKQETVVKRPDLEYVHLDSLFEVEELENNIDKVFGQMKAIAEKVKELNSLRTKEKSGEAGAERMRIISNEILEGLKKFHINGKIVDLLVLNTKDEPRMSYATDPPSEVWDTLGDEQEQGLGMLYNSLVMKINEYLADKYYTYEDFAKKAGAEAPSLEYLDWD